MKWGEKKDFDKLMEAIDIPKFVKVTNTTVYPYVEDAEAEVKRALAACPVLSEIKPGDSVAIATGSREIDRIVVILRTLVSAVRELGGEPFIVPAMGSHGGATAEGQKAMLDHFGINEQSVGAPIRSSMETVLVGVTPHNIPAYMDKNAAGADHIIPVGRVKAHTDFHGKVESGLMKMLTIGLGKQRGASTCHKQGFGKMEQNVFEIASVDIEKKPVLFGLAVIENPDHKLAMLEAVPARDIPTREPELLIKAKSLLPRIPVEGMNVLLVQEMGKDFSGTGMDSNVTGRSGNAGYTYPFPERLAVLDLTAKSDGNSIGMGVADVMSKRIFDQIDFYPIYVNAITSGDPIGCRMPMVMETDKQVLKSAIYMSRCEDNNPTVVWIKNTGSVRNFYVSEKLTEQIRKIPGMEIVGDSFELQFDEHENLVSYWN